MKQVDIVQFKKHVHEASKYSSGQKEHVRLTTGKHTDWWQRKFKQSFRFYNSDLKD